MAAKSRYAVLRFFLGALTGGCLLAVLRWLASPRLVNGNEARGSNRTAFPRCQPDTRRGLRKWGGLARCPASRRNGWDGRRSLPDTNRCIAPPGSANTLAPGRLPESASASSPPTRAYPSAALLRPDFPSSADR